MFLFEVVYFMYLNLHDRLQGKSCKLGNLKKAMSMVFIIFSTNTGTAAIA